MTRIKILSVPVTAAAESTREFIRRISQTLPWKSPPYQDIEAVTRAAKLEELGFKTEFEIVE